MPKSFALGILVSASIALIVTNFAKSQPTTASPPNWTGTQGARPPWGAASSPTSPVFPPSNSLPRATSAKPVPESPGRSWQGQGQGQAQKPLTALLIDAWQPLFTAPDAPFRGTPAKVFTYVLTGNIGGAIYNSANFQISESRSVTEALLREVKLLPRSADLDTKILSRANVFYIPTRRGQFASATELEKFNFNLSDVYRHRIIGLLSDREDLAQALSGRGPYLVAFRKPVSEIDRSIEVQNNSVRLGNEVLLIDMSEATPESVTVYISSFKRAVRDESIANDTTLAPLRARFASALVRLNRAIPFMAEAYAGVASKLTSAQPSSEASPRPKE